MKTLQPLATVSLLCSLNAIASTAAAQLATVEVASSDESIALMGWPDNEPVPVPLNTAITAKIVGSKVVALDTSNGTSFFRAVNGGGGDIDARTSGIGGYEKFLMLYFDDGTLGFRTLTGNYAWARSGGGSDFKATAVGIGNYERYTPEWHNGRLALRTYKNYYVRAAGGGNSDVYAPSLSVTEAETFGVHELSSYASELKPKTINLYPSTIAQTKMGLPTNQPIPMTVSGDVTVNGTTSIRLYVNAWGTNPICPDDDGNIYAEIYDSPALDSKCRMLWIRFSDGTCAFRTASGKYLTAVGGGGDLVTATATGVGEFERFFPIQNGSSIQFRALDGHYLGNSSPSFRADRDEGQTWTITSAGWAWQPAAFVATDSNGNAITTSTYSGNLKLKMGFDTIDLMGASVYMDSEGYWSGTVSAFQGGIFDTVQLNGSQFTIGHRHGDDLPFDAPVDPTGEYYFIQGELGASISVGGVSIGPPIPSGQAMFILDPTGPTIYVDAGGFFPEPEEGGIQIDDAGIGFSLNDRLYWDPVTNWHNQSSITSRTGNFYVNGAASLGIKDSNDEDVASISGSADMVLDLNWNQFANGNLGSIVQSVAMNNTVSVSFKLNQYLEAGIDLGSASAVYERGNYFAVSGVINPGNLGGFPGLNIFKANAKAAAYAGFNGEWYLDFAAKCTYAGGVGLKGNVHIGDDGATIDGTVDLGATSYYATGVIGTNGSFSLTASKSFSSGKWNFDFGYIYLKGSTTATASNNGFATGGSLQGCYKVDGDAEHCDSINGSASFTVENGKVKVCGDISVPAIDNFHKCTSVSF